MARVLDQEPNPYVGSLLVALRDVRTQGDRRGFRDALSRLGEALAYEIAQTLPIRMQEVITPLGSREEPVVAEAPVLAMILRASIPLWDGMLRVFQDCDTVVIGAARAEGATPAPDGSLPIELSYLAAVPLAGRTLIYADPMLATGSTLRAIHPMLCERAGTPARVIVASAIAYRGTLDVIERELGAEIIVASADDELDDRGYIVPGLGDAGDLAFGAKL